MKHATRYVSLVLALALCATSAAFAAIPTDPIRVSNRAALESLTFDAVPAGVVSIVPDGRGLRLIGLNGRDVLRLAAPAVVDAHGQPSHRAWWTVDDGQLRLRLDDELLAYPLTIQPQGSTSKPAPRFASRTDAHGGLVAGTLTDAVTGDPVPYQLVHAYDNAGVYVESAIADETGVYTFPDLTPGTYYIVAIPYEYETQLYNGISCPNKTCSVTSGTAVVVTQGSEVRNIDFALQSFIARVSGRVLDADTNTPLANVIVNFYDVNANRVSAAYTNGDGEYIASIEGSGSYYARTQNLAHEGYIDELYSETPCTACDVLGGTAVSATVGQVTTGIDFTLDPDGGRISGRVTDGVTGDPIRFENVYILADTGETVTYGQTDENGDYTSFNGLAGGNYYAYVQPRGYTAEIWNDVACDGECTILNATAIAVTAGSTTGSINFALGSSEARIAGRVTIASTGEPLGNVEIGVFNSQGQRVTSAMTDEATGDYSAAVQGGTYYVRTFASFSYPGYVDELWNNIPCSSCNVTTGTAVQTTLGSVTSGIDFALAGGGSISGRLVEDGTGTPIDGATVLVYNANGTLTTYGTTDANGDYTTVNALQSGNYYVVATPFGYTRELYNNLPCPDDQENPCNVTAGTAVAVTFGSDTPNINFSLASQIARISGVVRDSVTNLGIAADVYFYDGIGNVVTVASTNPSTGAYSTNVGTTGTYYARTYNYSSLHMDELYNNIPCAACNPTTGTGINATVGATTANIDFLLDEVGCPAITVNPASLNGGNEGNSYFEMFTASGGNGNYTFSVSGGALPAGITLNGSTGALSGTLTPAGSYSFEIMATDTASNCRGTRDYTIDIVPGPPTFTSLSPTVGPSSGGQNVTISGSSLTTVASVSFGGTDGTILTVTDTSVVVRTPPHAAGFVDVTVNTSGGSATLTSAYQFVQSPSITLTSSPNPSVYTQTVTLSVTLSNPSATGTITYYDGETTVIGTSSVSGGTSSLAISTLSVGTHELSARYTSDGDLGIAGSNIVTHDVNKSPRTITVTSLNNPSTWGDSVTFVATLAPSGEEAATVTFYNGPAVLGTAAVSGNQAQLAVPGLEPGTYEITATTAATTSFFAGTSNTLTQVVNKATRTIDLSSSPNPSTYPEAVTITASLAPADEASTVAFYDGATFLGTSPVVSGTATLTIPTGAWNAGTHAITATTDETAHYLASSAVLNHVVQKAQPVFTNLSAPTIIIGTASVTISGNIAAGALIPPGSVTITVNSVTTTVPIGANGDFSTTIATNTFGVGAYPISFTYAGSTNFAAATATSNLNVTYGIQLVQYQQIRNAGSTIPIRIKLINAAGVNLSNSTIDVTLVGYKLTSAAAYTPLTGAFNFQNAQGGSYHYNWQTPSVTGNYLLAYQVEGDPVIHTIAFTLN
ncbi:MAG TPA: carboxypeptidase regulatory-like domain-containing protein [Thermoanaerobaculia bacterium]